MKALDPMQRGLISSLLALLLAACGGSDGGSPAGAFGGTGAGILPGELVGSAADANADAGEESLPPDADNEGTVDIPPQPGGGAEPVPGVVPGTGTASPGTGTVVPGAPVETALEAEERLGRVVLDVNYENGATNSGIAGLMPTNAPGSDAVGIVSGVARSGRYSLSHKVTLDDPAYFSFNHPRSETDTTRIWATQHRPGMRAIYKFSMLFKDWKPHAHPTRRPSDIVWQFKVTNGTQPDSFIKVRENGLVIRHGGAMEGLIWDIRPYNNKWIDFRMDVFWSDKNTGWIKVWVRPDGQAEFKQVVNSQNIRTYYGDPANTSQRGYIKWGLYRPDSYSREAGTALTREIYHDDIKMIVMPPP